MVMAADMSVRLGWIEPEILDRTVALLKRANLPVEPPKVRCHGVPSAQVALQLHAHHQR
jgi:3-dehydroquinate synthetase